ncbi:MAG: Flp family type IVb pilin [Dermatophilaceae bacterium]
MDRSTRRPRPRRCRDENGATAVEYALLVAFIALAIVGSVAALAPVLNDIFTEAVAPLL